MYVFVVLLLVFVFGIQFALVETVSFHYDIIELQVISYMLIDMKIYIHYEEIYLSFISLLKTENVP